MVFSKKLSFGKLEDIDINGINERVKVRRRNERFQVYLNIVLIISVVGLGVKLGMVSDEQERRTQSIEKIEIISSSAP